MFKKTCISVLSALPMGISSVPIHDYVRRMAKQTESLLQANPHHIVLIIRCNLQSTLSSLLPSCVLLPRTRFSTSAM